MRRIRVENPQLDKNYQTYLGADYSSGTSLTGVSNVSFAINDILVIGEPREESTEAKKCNSVSGTTIFNLASALNFSHNKGTPIYKTLWDQVVIEADYGLGFSVITTSALQWDNPLDETIYFDPNGTNSTSYRFHFYNSVTGTYSEYSPTLTGAMPARGSVNYMIDQVRKIAGDTERKIVDDDEIIRYLNRAQEIIYAHNGRYWFLYVDTKQAANGITALTTTSVYSLASYTDFGHLASIRYQYNNGTFNELYHLRGKPEIEFDRMVRNQSSLLNTDYPAFYKLLPVDDSSANGYFQINRPLKSTSVGTFYPNYYKKPIDLATVDEVTIIPIPAILEDYAIAQVLKIKGQDKRAAIFESQFFGPPDRRQTIENLSGLALLDELDRNNRRSTDQPRSLFAYRGRLGTNNFYGQSRTFTHDFEKENFF